MTDQWRIWHTSVRQAAIDESIRAIYAAIDEEVNQKSPTCWISGRCCDFNAYDHRLFVTGLEIAWVLNQLAADQPKSFAITPEQSVDEPCVYQRDKLCTIHAVRPLGCRIYFCQEGTDAWQQEVYEQFMKSIRFLHDDNDLPYGYMEWRGGLQDGMVSLNAIGEEDESDALN